MCFQPHLLLIIYVDTSFNHGLCCLNSKEYAVQRIEIHRACGEYRIHFDKAMHELLVSLFWIKLHNALVSETFASQARGFYLTVLHSYTVPTSSKLCIIIQAA